MADKKRQKPTRRGTSPQGTGLQQYTDSQLIEELKRRGFEVLKWDAPQWQAIRWENEAAPEPPNAYNTNAF